MGKVKKILKKISKIIPDRLYISLIYFHHFHKFPNLKNPQTFNEKLQWLKLYDRRPEYSTMVDKYRAKEYVARIIGDEYIIPTIGVWNSVDEIDWDSLPNQFVLKWNHDSGSIVICKDKTKLDRNKAILRLRKNEHSSGYWYGREWPYKNVNPCIIAEKYMEDESGELRDYKFFCFNGKAKFFKVDFGRYVEHHANYYDTKCNLLPFGEESFPSIFEKKLKMPENIDRMIELAEKLAENIPFIRVDFYDVRSRIYFGELTLFPASGFGRFTSNEWDYKIGDMIDLKI